MLIKRVDYSVLKTSISIRAASVQWIDYGDFYWLGVIDGNLTIEASLNKLIDAADVQDFETNLKAAGNKTLQPPSTFLAKTMRIGGVDKKLYARNTGVQQTLSAGSNTISYTVTYPWVKIVAVEVINGESLDYVNLKVKDDAIGTYSTVPNYVLNQFAYSHNIPKDYYIRLSQFDADLYVGMVIEVTYNSVSAKTVGINFIMNEVKS